LLLWCNGFFPDHNDVPKIDYGSFDGTQTIAEICGIVFQRFWHFDMLIEADVFDFAKKPVGSRCDGITRFKFSIGFDD
jgi:hypothetical protein